MIRFLLASLAVAYLPGALLFRLPVARRERRASLSAEERLFWHVILSVAWSLAVTLALATMSRYRFSTQLLSNCILSAAIVVFYRGRLGYRGTAGHATPLALLPAALLALASVQFFPPAEYIIGGKDPGTYINEGIQIAQRGGLVISDPAVAAVPVPTRDLFFPRHEGQAYYSNRFMGFFLLDPDAGRVIGQFPHLFPASIAIAYGLDGLSGARNVVGWWAALGLLAVYFAGARLLGRPAAFAAAALLGLHVITVWFGRYPNAESAMQPWTFALLLAFARAHQDEDPFFAPVAGVMAALFIFLKIDGVIVFACMSLAALAMFAAERRVVRWTFLLPLALAAVPAWLYWSGPMEPYIYTQQQQLLRVPPLLLVAGGAALAVLTAMVVALQRRLSEPVRATVPWVVSATAVLGASYAYFLRAPVGRLADYDAYAFRTFTDFFLFPAGAAAAVIGIVVLARRATWRDPALLCVIVGASCVLLYKIKIVPDHFWMERRLVPVILPGALLAIAAASFGMPGGPPAWWRPLRMVGGTIFVAMLGWQYAVAAAPVRAHVEYAGMIPYLEALAGRVGERDLVIVEARDAGVDTHVLALPLAYIYAKNVLVLNSARPDKAMLQVFLEDAFRRYERVLFLGGGQTDLLSRRIQATAIADGRVKVPEYDAPAWNVYPAGIRRKDFDYSLYALTIDAPIAGGFALDIGDRDDLNVIRFNAKETSEGRTVRWTLATSQIAVPGLRGVERELLVEMHDGGRPAEAGRAQVTASLNDVDLGTVDVLPGFHPYRWALPADVVLQAAARDEPAQIRLKSTVWTPRDVLGGTDDRVLGVMVDRVEIK